MHTLTRNPDTLTLAAPLVPDAWARVTYTALRTDDSLDAVAEGLVAAYASALLCGYLAQHYAPINPALSGVYADKAKGFYSVYYQAVIWTAPVQEMRTTLNLSPNIPELFLTRHLTAAYATVLVDTGLAAYNGSNDFALAQIYQAYYTALPLLNTFTLQGASQARGLAVELDARFMNGPDVRDAQRGVKQVYLDLIKRLRVVPAATEPLSWGGIQMVAI